MHFRFPLILAVLIAVVGCRPGSNEPADGRPIVYTSFYPLYDFAQKIGGDKVQVCCLIRPGTKAHDWEPSPRDLANLSKADLFLCNGLGMEPWIKNAVDAMGNVKFQVVETAQGIDPITGGHHHEHGDHHEHHDDYSAPDPHVWLSPVNVKIILKNIADAFVKLDSDNAKYYQENLQIWTAKCDELDKQYRETLSDAPQKEIVVSHQAFGYLCREYGLTQIPIEGLTAQSDPGMARMAELVKKIRDDGITTVFVESSQDSRICDALAKETGAKVDVLNPYETLYDDQIQAGDDYFSVMTRNLEALKKAVGMASRGA